MRKTIYVMTAIISISLFWACSYDEEVAKANDIDVGKKEAVMAFDKKFKKEFNYMASTRNIAADAENEKYDSILASTGRHLAEKMEVQTNEILCNFGITDEILEEIYNENVDLGRYSSLEELKCFTALSIYDTFVLENIENTTRATWIGYVSCIGIGSTMKDLSKLPAKQIAKFAAKKLIGRLVPYVGWGWAIASASYCIANL